MKHRVLLTALTAGLLGLGSAHAQSPASKDGAAMFDALDANADGQLSAEELGNMRETMAKQRFARADANGDGSIDRDEFLAGAEQRAERLFARMDRNDDGILDAEEASPRHHGRKHGEDDGHHAKHGGGKDHRGGKRHFDPMQRMDRNEDGTVSRDEWDAAVERHHERHGKHGA